VVFPTDIRLQIQIAEQALDLPVTTTAKALERDEPTGA
jgi:hypothetical protein